MKWLALCALAGGAALIGGAFSAWDKVWSQKLLVGGIVIAGFGAAIESEIGTALRKYFSWRRNLDRALREQGRIRLQLDERISKEVANNDTIELVLQLLETEDDNHIDDLSDYVTKTILMSLDNENITTDLIWKISRYWHHCSLGMFATLFFQINQDGRGNALNKALLEISTQCEMRLSNIIKHGTVSTIRHGDVALLKVLLTNSDYIPGKDLLLTKLDIINETILARQAQARLR